VLRTGIEQGMSNNEGQKELNGYQVNRKSGCRVAVIRVSGKKTEDGRQDNHTPLHLPKGIVVFPKGTPCGGDTVSPFLSAAQSTE
jgi:hypothetical protein